MYLNIMAFHGSLAQVHSTREARVRLVLSAKGIREPRANWLHRFTWQVAHFELNNSAKGRAPQVFFLTSLAAGPVQATRRAASPASLGLHLKATPPCLYAALGPVSGMPKVLRSTPAVQ